MEKGTFFLGKGIKSQIDESTKLLLAAFRAPVFPHLHQLLLQIRSSIRLLLSPTRNGDQEPECGFVAPVDELRPHSTSPPVPSPAWSSWLPSSSSHHGIAKQMVIDK
ncbi:hypothetical protein U9M48_015386 [Paspalum notatum var. saurae]|uniref:Uncharacterized protein n=1 Tax=Paspalum notatum var. saurae TaxID=547442 RepID=A0AAQ3T313_PASNO